MSRPMENNSPTSKQMETQVDFTKITKFHHYLQENELLELFNFLPHHSTLEFDLVPNSKEGRTLKRLFVGLHKDDGARMFAFAPGSFTAKSHELQYRLEKPTGELKHITAKDAMSQGLVHPFDKFYTETNMNPTAISSVSAMVRLYFCMKGYMKEENIGAEYKKVRTALTVAMTQRVEHRDAHLADSRLSIRQSLKGSVKETPSPTSAEPANETLNENDIQLALQAAHLRDLSDNGIEMTVAQRNSQKNLESGPLHSPSEGIVAGHCSSHILGAPERMITPSDAGRVGHENSSLGDGVDAGPSLDIDSCRAAVAQNTIHTQQVHDAEDELELIETKLSMVDSQERTLKAFRQGLEEERKRCREKVKELRDLRYQSYAPYDDACFAFAMEQIKRTGETKF